MSQPQSGSVLKDNWYLFLILIVLVTGLACYALLGPSGDIPIADANTSAQTTPVREPTYATQGRPGEADKAREIINGYEVQLSENPNHEDAPALLFASANLYKQKLRDYRAAAEKYQLILLEHPEWPQAKQCYPLLDTCYDQLEDIDGKKWLYEFILAKEPEDSQEYLYATMQMEKL